MIDRDQLTKGTEAKRLVVHGDTMEMRPIDLTGFEEILALQEGGRCLLAFPSPEQVEAAKQILWDMRNHGTYEMKAEAMLNAVRDLIFGEQR